MALKLKKLFLNHKGLWLALFIFFAGTFTLLDTGKHFAFNLDPYPDGIFYTLPAWNFVHGQGFSMQFAQSNIGTTVPPLYTVLLIPFYAIFPTPVAFYALNVALGTLSLCFLYFLIKENTHAKWAAFVVALFALLPVILWLPAVPMAENLLLPLVTITTWLWLTKKIPTDKKLIPLLLLQAALFFTKYSSFTFLIPFNMVLLWDLYQQKQFGFIKKYLLLLIGLVASYALISRPSFILNVFRPQAESKTGTEINAFSFQYVPGNIAAYLKSLLGFPAYFLWQKFMFFIPGLLLIPLAALFKKERVNKLLISRVLMIAFGTVMLQSFFYAVDTRYIIATLPLLFLTITLSLETLLKKRSKLLPLVILGASAVILLVTQKAFYKQLIGSNWLQRSTAWQAEAIKHFKSLNLPTDVYLITALPPYLFNFYYPNSPQLLPLSKTQEFMNIGQRPWGNAMHYDDFSATYRDLIQRGKKVYISNAYITHQQSVIADFENYKQDFELRLIKTGCQETCNVYEVLTR
jgi:hypothetical protein